MKYLIAILSIAFIWTQAEPALAQGVPAKPKEYIGEVIIVGNNITQDRVIRRVLLDDDLVPGQLLVRGDLKKTEVKLVRLGLFKADPKKKTGPKVTVLESDGPFKDILVKVEEINTREMKWESGLDALGHPVLRLVMKDRNFDPFGWPVCIGDILEGNVFRGGGQKIHIALFQVHFLEGRATFFPQGLIIPALIRPLIED